MKEKKKGRRKKKGKSGNEKKEDGCNGGSEGRKMKKVGRKERNVKVKEVR